MKVTKGAQGPAAAPSVDAGEEVKRALFPEDHVFQAPWMKFVVMLVGGVGGEAVLATLPFDRGSNLTHRDVVRAFATRNKVETVLVVGGGFLRRMDAERVIVAEGTSGHYGSVHPAVVTTLLREAIEAEQLTGWRIHVIEDDQFESEQVTRRIERFDSGA